MITTYLPWLLSIGTVTVLWYAPTRPRLAWTLGIALQPVWALFAIAADAYGLLPLSLVLAIVYARNLKRHLDQPYRTWDKAQMKLYNTGWMQVDEEPKEPKPIPWTCPVCSTVYEKGIFWLMPPHLDGLPTFSAFAERQRTLSAEYEATDVCPRCAHIRGGVSV